MKILKYFLIALAAMAMAAILIYGVILALEFFIDLLTVVAVIDNL